MKNGGHSPRKVTVPKEENKMGAGGNAAAVTFAAIGLLFGIASFVMVVILFTDPRVSPLMSQRNTDEMATHDGTQSNLKQVSVSQTSHLDKDEKTYLIGVEEDWKPYAFVDLDGYPKGLYVDLIRLVCQRARKHCRLVVTHYDDCWSSEKKNGPGLQNHWYDGCTVYTPTVERSNVFQFTGGLVAPVPGHFFTKHNTTMNHTELPTKKVGFWSGWYTDAGCIYRGRSSHGLVPKVNRHYFETVAEAIVALNKDEVDLLFMPASAPGVDHLMMESIEYKCSLGSSGLMTRKDNAIDSWFEPTFKVLREEGKLAQMCDESHMKYGKEAKCDL